MRPMCERLGAFSVQTLHNAPPRFACGPPSAIIQQAGTVSDWLGCHIRVKCGHCRSAPSTASQQRQCHDRPRSLRPPSRSSCTRCRTRQPPAVPLASALCPDIGTAPLIINACAPGAQVTMCDAATWHLTSGQPHVRQHMPPTRGPKHSERAPRVGQSRSVTSHWPFWHTQA